MTVGCACVPCVLSRFKWAAVDTMRYTVSLPRKATLGCSQCNIGESECRGLWTVSTRTAHSPALALAPGEGSSELSSRGGEVATSRASRRSVVAFAQIEAIGGEKAAVDFGGATWAPHGPHGTRTRARTLRASCASFTRMHTWPRHARRFLHGRRPPDLVRARNVAGNRRRPSVTSASGAWGEIASREAVRRG